MALLGIGLLVYNDEKDLSVAIESVLKQTFQDFELHIFDNCSTDSSFEIAQEYAEKDSRISVHKNSINVGIAENYNHCLSIRGYKYISLKSSNDVIFHEYYEKCVDFLEKNQEYVACYTEGTNTLKYGGLFSYEQDDVYERLSSVVQSFKYGNMIYGVFRLNIIDKLLPFMPMQGIDHMFMFNVAMMGKLKKIDEVLYDREQPINRTDEQYYNACHSSFKSSPSLKIPYVKSIEMLLGHIYVCNNGFLNGLDRDKLVNMVIDTFFRSKKRKRDLVDGYFSLKKWLRKNRNVNDIDYYELKTMLRRTRFYMLKNKQFRKHHPIEWLKGIFDRVFI